MNFKQSLAYILVFLEVVTAILLYLYVNHASGVILFGFGILTLFLIFKEASQTIEYTLPQFFDLISHTDMGQGLQIPNWRDLEKSNKELGHPKIQIEEVSKDDRIYGIYFKNETGLVWAMVVELLLKKTDPIENAVKAVYSPEINPTSPTDIRYYIDRLAHGVGFNRGISMVAKALGKKPEDVLREYFAPKGERNENNK